MNRRTFLATIAAVPVAARLPWLPPAPVSPPTFWQSQGSNWSQGSASFDHLKQSMRDIYNQCSRGVSTENVVWILPADHPLADAILRLRDDGSAATA